MKLTTVEDASAGETRKVSVPRIVPQEKEGPPMLLVTAGSSAGAAFSITDGLVIGRAQESDVVLEDIGVSRRHAQIERDDTGYKLRDLGSTNGTFVEGRPIESHYLREGDTFQCGDEARLKFGWRILGDDPVLALELLVRLPGALRGGEFGLAYQPIVHLSTRKMVGVEALVRWNTATDSIQPAQFLALAEDTGFIIPLGEKILRDALSQLTDFKRQGLKLFMTVNLSPRQLVEAGGTVLEVVASVPEHEADLVLDLAGDPGTFSEPAREVLARLSRAGVRLALDDFGHGSTTLEQIRALQVQMLKLDSRFVAGLPDDPEHRRMAVAVTRLAESLNLRSLAKGIETARQYEYLFNNGYNLGQGFYFSKPVEAEKIPRLAREGTADKEIFPAG